MIRYLEQDEKWKSRELWEEAFPEDAKGFVDYYYERRAADNRILVKEEAGRIVSMLHRNPYQVAVRDRVWKTDYIVGVATKESCRHRGHMRDVLNRMMADMYEEGRQFCFLMPADVRIYLPFQFAYIFDQPRLVLRKDGAVTRLPCRVSERMGAAEPAAWADRWLRERYEVYCRRDKAYMERFLLELASEDGVLYLIRHGGELVGLESVWGLRKKETRELLCEEPYVVEEGPAKPAVMARIVHLREFVKAISLAESCPTENLTVGLTVEDPMIAENNGDFLWRLDRFGSRLEPGTAEERLTIPIQRLTAWLFGYEELEAEVPWSRFVRRLKGVYLDEVV